MTLRLKILLAITAITAWFAFVTENPSAIATPSFPDKVANKVINTSDIKMSNDETSAKKTDQINGSMALPHLIPRSQLIASQTNKETIVDLFKAANWIPAPPPVSPVVITIAPPQAVAPPLDFRFIGKAIIDGQLNIFLARQEKTLVVKEGQSIDANYKVGKIQPPTMELIYLPLNEIQTLIIGNAIGTHN
ncbi:hypothetical protein [Undibacterium flavidum]|uniref:Uncharacterized protein n=1 Tax=Undibacterium flavidum TaxID=2762297 RepID=A0ABR6YEA6_9BURK|nr:hypothetical protein [Undibacterium flavidum]MBC3874897.1 hypothetical protein [Undibacterium flavidum]